MGLKMGGEDFKAKSLLTFDELLESVYGRYIGFAGGGAKVFGFTSVATDSRNVKPGSLFVPLVGEKQDGHRYIPEALAAGATAVFVTDSVYQDNTKYFMDLASENLNITFVAVENNLAALQNAARAYVQKFPKLIKIGITGSSGKTTTKEILASILKEKYNVIATEGNFNSETGLPLSVFNIRPEHEVGVFEMGMNRKNEIGEIARVLAPNYAIITNIGNAHIGILGSRENIAEEKRKIFNYINENGAAFVPDEDDFANYLLEGVKGKRVRFGKNVPESVSGVQFVSNDGIGGTRFAIDGIETRLAIPGLYNYTNALGCVALAKTLGLGAKEICAGLEKVKTVDGRGNVIAINTKKNSKGESKKVMLMYDCYNANPDSMEKALSLCGSLEIKGRMIFVLGDMKELGDASAQEHSRIGALATLSKPNLIVFVGPEMENGAKAAKLSGFANVKYFPTADVDKVSSCILEYANDDDFILLKASHSMNFDLIAQKISAKEELSA
ncbi:MAG: UDP-N-acetylmuramoyl-tripeptide--D-alanyl-D-alanine ligase [Treponema sp.]|nr:UDP-N-acetylmuramoyl-tripeptide--D-alanyl-D-alanine ligase [Treponema sp.]